MIPRSIMYTVTAARSHGAGCSSREQAQSPPPGSIACEAYVHTLAAQREQACELTVGCLDTCSLSNQCLMLSCCVPDAQMVLESCLLKLLHHGYADFGLACFHDLLDAGLVHESRIRDLHDAVCCPPLSAIFPATVPCSCRSCHACGFECWNGQVLGTGLPRFGGQALLMMSIVCS